MSELKQTEAFRRAEPPAVPPELVGKSLRPVEVTGGDTEEEARKKVPSTREKAASASGFSTDVHNYLMENIILADQKAAFLFATVTGVLAYLHSTGATRRWLTDPRNWQCADLLSFVAVLGLVGGAISSLLVVIPRLGGEARGLVYWRAIANFPNRDTYAVHVLESDKSVLTREMLGHCYELAKICVGKYRFVNVAILLGAAGLASTVIYLAFF